MNTSSIEINRSLTTNNVLSLTIPNEDHTLGTILHTELLKDEDVEFAGYRKHHPLEDNIELRVSVDEGHQNPNTAHPAIPLILDASNRLVHNIDKLIDSIKKLK